MVVPEGVQAPPDVQQSILDFNTKLQGIAELQATLLDTLQKLTEQPREPPKAAEQRAQQEGGAEKMETDDADEDGADPGQDSGTSMEELRKKAMEKGLADAAELKKRLSGKTPGIKREAGAATAQPSPKQPKK